MISRAARFQFERRLQDRLSEEYLELTKVCWEGDGPAGVFVSVSRGDARATLWLSTLLIEHSRSLDLLIQSVVRCLQSE